MKRVFYFITCMFALALASCSSDENVDSGVPQSAKFEVTLSGKAAQTRSTNTSVPAVTDEGTVNDIVVAAFDRNNNVVKIDVQTMTGLTSSSITATTAVTAVAVAANVQAKATDFSTCKTKADFYATVAKLAVTTADVSKADNQDAKLLPMVGESTGTVTLDATNSVNVSVTISRLVARISISSITSDFSNTVYAGSSFVPEEIFLYNAITDVKYNGTNVATPTYYSGESAATSSTTPALASYLGTGAITYATTDTYYFYTFPNATATPTKLIIKGTFTDANNKSTPVYYPIIINHAQTGTTITATLGSAGTDSQIAANTTYALTANIKTIGATTVSANLAPADLDVTVTVSGWANTLTQNVIFE